VQVNGGRSFLDVEEGATYIEADSVPETSACSTTWSSTYPDPCKVSPLQEDVSCQGPTHVSAVDINSTPEHQTRNHGSATEFCSEACSSRSAPAVECNGECQDACLDDELTALRAKLQAAEARALQAELRLGMWEDLVSKMSSIVMMGPEMSEFYKRTLMKELTAALSSLDMVEQVKNLKCSFPAVRSEAPHCSLVRWDGDFSKPMEWEVQWSTSSWAISVSVIGRQFGLSFSLDICLHHFSIKGKLKVALPNGRALDLSQILVSFTELPQLDFAIDSKVAWGVVPLPVQSQVDAIVRSSAVKWLTAEMVDPNAMKFQLAALKPKRELSDADVQQAILDAERARKKLGNH